MPAPLMYVEFGATDLSRAAAFYRTLFGWTFAEPASPAYASFSSGPGGLSGGINRTDSIPPGGGIILYLAVDNIDSFCPRIESEGGRITRPKTDIPDVGWYALFTDPDGNLFGLFTQHPENKKTY